MSNLKKKIFFFTFLFLTFIGSAQIYNTQIEAEISLVSNGEFFEITGFATNKTVSSASLHYVLSVIKSNSNTSNLNKNEQKGRFVLEPGQKIPLSKVTVNSSSQDRVIILLLIYDVDDNILGKDRIVLNDYEADAEGENSIAVKEAIIKKNKLTVDAKHGGDDGVFLKGIVVENTKTKPGRDFFKAYSQKYNNNNILGEKIITIDEVIALGSNTRIQLKVENDVIFQFFVNPRADYIQDMVDIAIKRTSNYFDQLRRNRNSVKKY